MRQWTIDAFATAPFRGNPACVVEPVDQWPRTAWMNQLAQENNQSETAFLKRTGKTGEFELRWFTPSLEVPLCGHATLAAAHALATELGETSERFVFHTKSGALNVTLVGDGYYEMDFPSAPPHRIEMPEGLIEALGGPEPLEAWAGHYLLVVLNAEEDVRNVAPDLKKVKAIAKQATGGLGNLIVTAPAQNETYDVASRFFAPGAGVPEDPATGSAHCILAPFYAERLGKTKLTYHQAFPGRGGDLSAELRGDRVILQGRAITMVESRLRIQPD